MGSAKEFKDDPITENSEECQRLRQAEARAKRIRFDNQDLFLTQGTSSTLQAGTTERTEFNRTSASTETVLNIGASTVRSKKKKVRPPPPPNIVEFKTLPQL